MSYPLIPLNLSERSLPFKPKPRYSNPEDDRNSIGSPSPPGSGVVMPNVLLHPDFTVRKAIKYGDYSYLRGYLPPITAFDESSLRFSSPMMSCGLEYHLPASPMFTGVPYGCHYPFVPMKMSPTLPGYEEFLYTMRRPKRVRTAFTPTQLLTLENAFEKNHYVVGSERKQLAQNLGLSETQVKVWFQNRRTKHKRQKQDGESCSNKTSGKDCLDCREDSYDEDELSSDDEMVSKIPSFEDLERSKKLSEDVTRSKNSCFEDVTSSKNSSFEDERSSKNPSPVLLSESDEIRPKTSRRAIWNPITIEEKISLPQSVMCERTE